MLHRPIRGEYYLGDGVPILDLADGLVLGRDLVILLAPAVVTVTPCHYHHHHHNHYLLSSPPPTCAGVAAAAGGEVLAKSLLRPDMPQVAANRSGHHFIILLVLFRLGKHFLMFIR